MSEQETFLNLTLYDRIFKPQVMTLKNGHTVLKKRSRLPLYAFLFIVVVSASFYFTGFDLILLTKRIHHLGGILIKLFQPKWSYFDKVYAPLLDTVKMSLLGTILGCLVSLPFAILASSNINKNKWTLSAIRLLLSVVRSVPTLITASVVALIFNLGTFSGTVAIALFTFGIVAKMLYESIETIDMGAYEAMLSFGANVPEAFWAACLPQILPTYFSHSLYCFEINVRVASILGYVGAGGLGILISERIGWRDYEGLGMVLLSLFVLVLLIDQLSQFLRSKLS